MQGTGDRRYSNRFEPLSEPWANTQSAKRARHSTGGEWSDTPPPPPQQFQTLNNIELNEIKQLPTDEKLNFIIEGMSSMGLLKYRIDNMESHLYVQSATHEVTQQRLRLLEYKSIDAEARYRESNIIITGITESRYENTVNLVRDTISNNLKMDPSQFIIVRAFRLGRVITPRAPHLRQDLPPKPRFILATFSHAGEVEALMNSASLLKDTNIGLSRDYPKEISEARKILWPEFKSKRNELGKDRVKLLFPAAIKVDGRITRNLFPEWFETLRGSRFTDVPKRISLALKSKSESIRQAYDTQFANQNRSEPSHTSPSRSQATMVPPPHHTITSRQVDDSNPATNTNPKSHHIPEECTQQHVDTDPNENMETVTLIIPDETPLSTRDSIQSTVTGGTIPNDPISVSPLPETNCATEQHFTGAIPKGDNPGNNG